MTSWKHRRKDVNKIHQHVYLHNGSLNSNETLIERRIGYITDINCHWFIFIKKPSVKSLQAFFCLCLQRGQTKFFCASEIGSTVPLKSNPPLGESKAKFCIVIQTRCGWLAAADRYEQIQKPLKRRCTAQHGEVRTENLLRINRQSPQANGERPPQSEWKCALQTPLPS